ncbi:P-loop containing nucleoside triphosphate hydrolase protein [Aspergillus pseudoustus]|uniref:P-loop containing nucleoside triphosphate hydrolase protein n=1 Tax=Aspergillus pseudoustus TaxID=1810923 RepID=A0ABR4JC32_9EURO
MLSKILALASLLWRVIDKFFDLLNMLIYAIECRLKGITKHAEIVITGPRNAGKTTLVHKLRTDSTNKQVHWRRGMISTAHLDHKHIRFMFIEPGGLAAPPVFGFLRSANALLLIVDGTDYDYDGTFGEARSMLDALLERDEIRGVPVAIFVNKIDRPGAVGPEEFMALMGFEYGGLDGIWRERAVEVFFGSVVVGQGIQEVIEWLSQHV